MRKKEVKLIITFDSTHQAMEMEDVCKAHAESGRLIPLPSGISAGCGLAWCSKPEDEEALTNRMSAEGIAYADMVLYEL